MCSDQIFEIAERMAILAVRNPDTYMDRYRYWTWRAQSLENGGWKKMAGKTQGEKIVQHLKKAGSITVREAIVEYSIQSLTKRIQELREAGYNIISNVKFHPITGQKYVRYTLENT